MSASTLTAARRRELEEIFGADRVEDTPITRRLYSQDLTALSLVDRRHSADEALPDAVVWPETVHEVSRLLRWASEGKVPVVTYGGGTSLRAATMPSTGAIVCDMKRMKRVTRMDENSMIVTAEAGILGEALQHELRLVGLTLGHFPPAFYGSTLGGFLATRSAGSQTSRYGRIEDKDGQIQDYTIGFGLAFAAEPPDGVLGQIHVGYDFASVPQATGLERVQYHTFGFGVQLR